MTEIDRNPYCNPYQNALFYPYCNPIKTRFSRAFGHFFVKQKRNEFCLRVCLGTQQPLLAPKPRLSDRTFGEMRGMQNTQRASVPPGRRREEHTRRFRASPEETRCCRQNQPHDALRGVLTLSLGSPWMSLSTTYMCISVRKYAVRKRFMSKHLRK